MSNKQHTRSNSMSAIVGGILLGIGCIWLLWLIFFQHNTTAQWTLSNLGAVGTPQVLQPPLQAAGLSLSSTDQKPGLSQQQALVLASQREPDAAAQAKSTNARYVLLNYPASSGASAHAVFNNVAVWLIWYQNIPLQPADALVDPTPFPRSHRDLYVFLDANTGNELLTIWD